MIGGDAGVDFSDGGFMGADCLGESVNLLLGPEVALFIVAFVAL